MARAATPDSSLPDRLLQAGERLFAIHGLDGISLRQISAEAGTKNNYAVQYHFGDASGLVRAILARRIPEFELRRADLLAKLPNRSSATTQDLIEVLFRPFSETGATSARFFLTLRTSSWGWSEMEFFTSEMSITNLIMEMIGDRLPHVPQAILRRRFKQLTYMFLAAVCEGEHEPEQPHGSDELLADLFEMAAGAIAVPPYSLKRADTYTKVH